MIHLLSLVVATGLLHLAATGVHAQAPAAVNVCDLLPREDIEALIGEKLRRSPRDDGRDMMTVRSDTCHYRSPGWIISANLERGRNATTVKTYMDTFRKVSGKQTGAKSVSGLGGDAWWTPVNENSGQLIVLRKTDVLTVSTSGQAAGAGSLEKTELVMKKLLAAYEKVVK